MTKQKHSYITKSKNAHCDLTRKIVCKHECHNELYKVPVMYVQNPQLLFEKKCQTPASILCTFEISRKIF